MNTDLRHLMNRMAIQIIKRRYTMNKLIESKILRTAFFALVMGASIGGCATVEGAGEDIESAGDAIEDAADDAS